MSDSHICHEPRFGRCTAAACVWRNTQKNFRSSDRTNKVLFTFTFYIYIYNFNSLSPACHSQCHVGFPLSPACHSQCHIGLCCLGSQIKRITVNTNGKNCCLTKVHFIVYVLQAVSSIFVEYFFYVTGISRVLRLCHMICV